MQTETSQFGFKGNYIKEFINFNNLSKIWIAIFLISTLIWVCLTTTFPVGESDDYMIASITLQNHLSLEILESDIEQVSVDFPEHYEYIKSIWDNGGFLNTEDGRLYPFYFGTYSFLCIPMKILLKLLGLSQSYAFAISNVLFYVGALIFVYCKLGCNRKIVFLTLLLLTCNPACAYLTWPLAEILIFSLVVVAAVCLANKRHHASAIFISIAGTLNPTIMAFGFFVIVDYILDIALVKDAATKNIILRCIKNKNGIFLLILCYCPFIISILLNYIKFGAIIPQLLYGFNRTDKWLERFWAYFVDLNFGFLPYFTIPLLLFVVLIVHGVYKRNVSVK
jgi:hypothetical protein